MKVMVFGATGGTGTHVVERALAAGHDVTAFVRDPAKVTAKVRTVRGDVTNPAEVAAALAGHDAALSSIGPRKGVAPGTLISDATRAIVGGLQAGGGRRFVFESGLMVGDLHALGFVARQLVKLFRSFNRALYRDKLVAEQLVRDSKLAWVIVRPPNLAELPARGTYRAGVDLDVHVAKKMAHADVAAAMVRALGEPAWDGQAVDLSY